MVIHTLFFASYRESIGSGGLDVTLSIGATVSDLIAELRSRGNKFACLRETVVIAVNKVYMEAETVLTDGDEVAFIPPVAGG